MINKFFYKNILVLTLCLATFIIIGLPLFRFGVGGAFYRSFDPDIVYITNALSYTKLHIITYADHPGTPTIMSLYFIFLPLRLLAKYAWHINFMDFAFNDYLFLNYYSRVFELILVTLGLFIFLKAVLINIKSKIEAFIVWFALLLFGGLGFGISAAPENLAFFLTSVWVYLFVLFEKKRSYFLNMLLVLVAGMAVANKFTALFLLIPSLFLPIFITKFKFSQKIVRFLVNILLSSASFYLGILPAKAKIPYIENWVIGLFYHAGIHATGSVSVFDKNIYLESFLSLIKGNPVTAIFVLGLLVITITLLIKRKVKVKDPYIFLLTTSITGIVIFAKYPLIHYNLVNLLLIIFCSSYLLSKARFKIRFLFFAILLVPFLISLRGYSLVGEEQFNDNAKILNFLSNDPAKQNILWEQGDNIYQILNSWTPYWSSDIFRDQFDKRPIMTISSDLKTVSVLTKTGLEIKKPFEVCWDKAFLQKENAAKFAELNMDKDLKLVPVPATNYVEIVYFHCTVN